MVHTRGRRSGGGASRKKRLTAEEKLLIVEDAASKEVPDVEVCRRWGIEPWDLRRFREQARRGALAELRRRPGRPAEDAKVKELKEELARTDRALKELSIELSPQTTPIAGRGPVR